MGGLGDLLRMIGQVGAEGQEVQPQMPQQMPMMPVGGQPMRGPQMMQQRIDMFRQSNVPMGFGNLMRYGGYYG